MARKFKKPAFNLIPQGNYRARVLSAVWDYSKAGNEMIVLSLKISGFPSPAKHWIASDWAADAFCSSFNIPIDALDSSHPEYLNSLIGKEGGVQISHEEINGGTFIKLKMLTQKQTSLLPPFLDIQKNTAPLQYQNSTQRSQPQNQNFQNFENAGFSDPQTPHNFDRNTQPPNSTDIPF